MGLFTKKTTNPIQTQSFGDDGVDTSQDDLFNFLAYIDSIAEIDPAEEMDRLDEDGYEDYLAWLEEQAFAVWNGFVQQIAQYIEDLDDDDIDRVYLAEELQELEDLFNQYEAGEITKEEFLSFEPEFIFDVPGATDYWNFLQEEVEGATEAVTEGVSSAVQDAIDAARDALPDDASVESILDWIAENIPEITPQSIFDEYIGAGVGINLPTGAPIGSGTVFIPGIPGLPSSSPNMVIGTVEEVLEDILAGNLPGVIGDIAEDPIGGIQRVIRGAVDDAQEVTADDLLGDADLFLGDDEGIDSVFDEPGQRTDYGGGLNDGETEDILAGVGGAAASAGGGATVQKPSGDFTPFMKRLDYRPVAIPEAVVPSLFREYFT